MSQQCIRQVEICAWAEGGKAMLKNEVSRPGSNSLDFVSLRFVNIHKLKQSKDFGYKIK